MKLSSEDQKLSIYGIKLLIFYNAFHPLGFFVKYFQNTIFFLIKKILSQFRLRVFKFRGVTSEEFCEVSPIFDMNRWIQNNFVSISSSSWWQFGIFIISFVLKRRHMCPCSTFTSFLSQHSYMDQFYLSGMLHFVSISRQWNRLWGFMDSLMGSLSTKEIREKGKAKEKYFLSFRSSKEKIGKKWSERFVTSLF